ncbi:hypothetical protein ND861_11700 [Leptospira sp. 2 VSF19]|uniref:Uncharacterized protein n=1 Tax=Leptospira soteropolitanensis TaxID=2950025 RepID=A0AAW5VPT9_9LEPT|nr:hypothetical protein [Leptospira soteropolitanensis]MCW7493030.1 hypothetical protein [Leptospira soteropolitanensis]MCW7500900.1 hypothetical protein [Leptospira soteropolitanensis]MCW7522881.1 hypothetical protein [Leptospira soteropolitanensis]MCW7527013.1 hypothetical protein [Leptospira soteropolitanensis]MCW7530599.1 hypothetical protein [Leptospira soteropolitanensis]
MNLTEHSQVSNDVYEPIKNWNQKDLGVLTGERGMYRLAHFWQYALVCSGFQVFNLDCAIRFNPFTIAEETRKQNLQPEPFLEQIRVQRAFTPYQILDAIQTILKTKEENTIYFLLAPCKQFLDGDVKEDEGLFLLNRMLAFIEKFPSENVPLLIIESWTYSHKNFQIFFPKLLQTTQNLWELKTEKGLSRIRTRKTSITGL